MSIEVELPDGTVVEFPDGTAPDVMKEAARKHIAKTMAPKPPPALPKQGEFASPAGDFIRDPKTGTAFRNATDFSTDMQNLGAGMGRAVDRGLDGVTQLYLKATGQDKANEGLEQNIAAKRRQDAPLMDTGAGKIGEGAGDAMMLAVPGSKVAQGARMLPKAYQLAAGLGGAGALTAAYEGTAKPTIKNESRGENMAWGFGAGALGQGIGNVAGRAIEGFVPVSESAKRLPKEVFDASTLGQVADRTSTAGRFASGTEEKLKSLPLTGGMIENARRRGVDAWRNELIDRASPEGFVAPKPDGKGVTMRDTMEKIQDEFGNRYRAALDGTNIAPSSPFEQRVLRVTTDPKAGLTQAQQEEIRHVAMSYYDNMFSGTPNAAGATPMQASGEAAKGFESFLRKQAAQYRRSNAPQAGGMADTYDQLAKAWTPAYRSQLPLATRQQLRPTDARYAPFKTVERATTAVGNEEGSFTPSQLLNSVKARTDQPRFARGDGLLQGDADAGKVIYGDKIPNSGTFDRAATAGLSAATFIDPITAAGTLAAGSSPIPMMITKSGKNFMTGRTRAQMMMQKLRLNDAARNSGPGLGEFMIDELE